MQITIIRDKCIGSGNCVMEADHVFAQSDEDGKVVLLIAEPVETERAMQAAMLCPVGAIMIDGVVP